MGKTALSPRKPSKSDDAPSHRRPAGRHATKPVSRRKEGSKGTTASAAKSSAHGFRSYRAALDFLGTLVNHEKKPPTARNRGAFTLTRIKRLLADLDNPQKAFKSVHVAGTKGKGSTCAMLSQMLIGAGLKVGLYTSPHIVDVRERISVNGELISEALFAKHLSKIAQLVEGYKTDRPTFFEIMTALAFDYFRAQGVEIAVLETGLGGRLDATNVVKPEVCGITNISLDHMAQLGNSLEAIAEEKAGIFKENVPIISAPQPKGIKQVLKKAAERIKAPLLFAGDDIEFSYRFESSRAAGPQARICVTTSTSHFDHLAVPLVGEHQAVNCGVAIGMLDQLKIRGFKIDDERAIAGLANVRLAGRMEFLCEKPRIIADGAHNAASIEALMRAIGQNVSYDSMVVIFGCCSDKDIPGMMQHIQLGADKVIFTRINSPRTADPADLGVAFAEGSSGRMAQIAPTLRDALEIAEKAVTRDDLICITGSFYLVAEAKSLFADHPHRPASTADLLV